MRIAIIGPLKAQFLQIQQKPEVVRALGTKHSLYFVDKDSRRAVSSLEPWNHYDAIIICTAWIKHDMVKILRNAPASPLQTIYINTRGMTGVADAIIKLVSQLP